MMGRGGGIYMGMGTGMGMGMGPGGEGDMVAEGGEGALGYGLVFFFFILSFFSLLFWNGHLVGGGVWVFCVRAMIRLMMIMMMVCDGMYACRACRAGSWGWVIMEI